MPVDSQNHLLRYRPLRGGIAVQNPVVDQLGTIGLIATSDGMDRWIISCYHVLCRNDGSHFPDGTVEPVFQPYVQEGDLPIGFIDGSRSDFNLDCAAAKVTVPALPAIFALGRIAAPQNPTVGMRVLKSGADTGLTEGIITDVSGNRVTIEAVDMPDDYQLTGPGDSGAVWVDANVNAPVALHQRGDPDLPGRRAFATSIQQILSALHLRL